MTGFDQGFMFLVDAQFGLLLWEVFISGFTWLGIASMKQIIGRVLSHVIEDLRRV